MRLEGWVHRVNELASAEFILLYRVLDGNKVHYSQVVNKGPRVKPPHGAYLVVDANPDKDCQNYQSGLLKQVISCISPTVSLPYRLTDNVTPKTSTTNRIFDLRRPECVERFLRVSEIKHRLITYLVNNKWVCIDTPKIQSASAESGGSQLFAVNFYGVIKYLSQSPQLYKQVCANIFQRVYQIGNIYRAEASDTPRHLAEATCLDIQMTTETLDTLYEVIRDLMAVTGLSRDIPVYTYDQLCKRIGKTDGLDFTTTQLKLLVPTLPPLYIVDKYPPMVKPFYIRLEGEYALGFDLYFEQIELASGGLREHRVDNLLSQLQARKLDAKGLDWYIDNFKYGCRPHGGFSIGLNRLYQKLLNLSDVRQVTLFPVAYGGKVY